MNVSHDATAAAEESLSRPLHEGLEGFLMREQDADVLESISGKEANRTSPFISSKKQEISLPSLSLPQTIGFENDDGDTRNMLLDDSQSDCSSTSSKSHHHEQPPAQSTCESLPTTSSTTSSIIINSPSSNNSSRIRTKPQSLLSRALQDYDVLKRADSKEERRIHEAAQYEQAVGEPAPVRIIDEEDDDEDEDEEHPETQVHSIVTSSSDKQRRRITHANSYSPPHETPRRRARSASLTGPRGSMILTQLPNSSTTQDFVYKGIHSNPPDIVKRGITRGNMAVLHRKAWLEVSDKYHRYGKHLRLYYRHWESIGFPTNQFFDWLDSKGEAAGCQLPEIADCPRSVLDSDTVLYITNPDITEQYSLTVTSEAGGRAFFRDHVGNPVITGDSGWIFVLRDNRWYGAPKITSVSGCSKQRFHHSSFFGGKAVAAAGIFITDDTGRLTKLYPHSGHYRPGEAHMQRVLFFFYHGNVDLRTFDIDTQQIEHVARDASGQKVSKLDSLHLHKAITVALFLAHKAKCIRCGLFQSIHQILKLEEGSRVSEILARVQ